MSGSLFLGTACRAALAIISASSVVLMRFQLSLGFGSSVVGKCASANIFGMRHSPFPDRPSCVMRMNPSASASLIAGAMALR